MISPLFVCEPPFTNKTERKVVQTSQKGLERWLKQKVSDSDVVSLWFLLSDHHFQDFGKMGVPSMLIRILWETEKEGTKATFARCYKAGIPCRTLFCKLVLNIAISHFQFWGNLLTVKVNEPTFFFFVNPAHGFFFS